MNKYHFIVSLALVSVLMMGSLGLAGCVPRGKNYNSSISNSSSLLNPDELADFVIGELNKFSEAEIEEFFTVELGGFSADFIQIRKRVWDRASPALYKAVAPEEKVAPATPEKLSKFVTATPGYLYNSSLLCPDFSVRKSFETGNI